MIKKGNDKKKVDPAKRVQLIRKGNQLFSEGKIEITERIFVTIDYKDGLVRLEDYYLKNNNLSKSAEMYFLSGNESKINAFCKKSALIIKEFLSVDKKNKYDKIILEKNRMQ